MSWIAFISRFTAFTNLVASFTSFTIASTVQSKRTIKVKTAQKMAVIKQAVPPFSKNQGNSCYTIGIISSNESTTAYLTFCAMYYFIKEYLLFLQELKKAVLCFRIRIKNHSKFILIFIISSIKVKKSTIKKIDKLRFRIIFRF